MRSGRREIAAGRMGMERESRATAGRRQARHGTSGAAGVWPARVLRQIRPAERSWLALLRLQKQSRQPKKGYFRFLLRQVTARSGKARSCWRQESAARTASPPERGAPAPSPRRCRAASDLQVSAVYLRDRAERRSSAVPGNRLEAGTRREGRNAEVGGWATSRLVSHVRWRPEAATSEN